MYRPRREVQVQAEKQNGQKDRLQRSWGRERTQKEENVRLELRRYNLQEKSRSGAWNPVARLVEDPVRAPTSTMQPPILVTVTPLQRSSFSAIYVE